MSNTIILGEKEFADLQLAKSSLDCFCAQEFVEDTKDAFTARDLITSVLSKKPEQDEVKTFINQDELDGLRNAVKAISDYMDFDSDNEDTIPVNDAIKAIKGLIKSKSKGLVESQKEIEKRKKISAYESQIKRQEAIRMEMNLNIVNCCNCDGIIIHHKDEEDLICPHCLQEVAPEDCSDYYYSGMNVDGEPVGL